MNNEYQTHFRGHVRPPDQEGDPLIREAFAEYACESRKLRMWGVVIGLFIAGVIGLFGYALTLL